MGCVSNTLAAQALALCICTDLLVSRSTTHFFCNTLQAVITRNCFFPTIANSGIPLADLNFPPCSLLVWLHLLWLSFYFNRSTDPREFLVAHFAPFLSLWTPDSMVTSLVTEQLFKTRHWHRVPTKEHGWGEGRFLIRESEYCCQKVEGRIPGRPRYHQWPHQFLLQFLPDRLSYLDDLSYLACYLPQLHMPPLSNWNQKSWLQVTLQKKLLLHYIHRHSVFSKIEMTEDVFPQGWENIWTRVCYFSSSAAFWQDICYNIFCSWIMDCCLPIVFININPWNLDWHLSCSFWILFFFFICTIFK